MVYATVSKTILHEQLLLKYTGIEEHLVPLAYEALLTPFDGEALPLRKPQVVAVYKRISGLNKEGMATFEYQGMRLL